MDKVISRMAQLLAQLAEAEANGKPIVYAAIWLDAWWSVIESVQATYGGEIPE